MTQHIIYSQNLKLGTSSESDRVNERLEKDLVGVMMSQLTLRNLATFRSTFIARIESMFGDMIRGKDARAELLSYFPLRVDNFALKWAEPYWIEDFRGPIMEYPKVREGMAINPDKNSVFKINQL